MSVHAAAVLFLLPAPVTLMQKVCCSSLHPFPWLLQGSRLCSGDTEQKELCSKGFGSPQTPRHSMTVGGLWRHGPSQNMAFESMVGCCGWVALSSTCGGCPCLFFFHLTPTLNFPVLLLPLLHGHVPGGGEGEPFPPQGRTRGRIL